MAHYVRVQPDVIVLSQAPRVVLPALINAYAASPSPELIEAIWQHRDPSTLTFLGDCARSTDDGAWKAALDGLVAMKATDVLRAVLEQTANEAKREWITEALEQAGE